MKTAPITAEYMSHHGDDLLVVNAARASFDKESWWADAEKLILKEGDAGLIRYLASGYRTQEWDEFLEDIIEAAHMYSGQAVKNALTHMLHGYKRRAQHWCPFGHPHLTMRVTMPIFLARQFVKHCVTGDTEVTFVKWVKGASNGTRKATIKALYEMWTGKANKYQGGAKGRRNVSSGHVRVYDATTQTFASSHITDVLHQGVKHVFKVTTESGQSLRVTGNHEVMTQRGWVRVDHLSCEDSMVTETGVGQLVTGEIEPRWNDWEDKQARRGVAKDMCAKCGATENLEADHIIPVARGGSHGPENMQCLCVHCHKEKSSLEKSSTVRNQYDPRYTRVVSIEHCGEEDVYDLTVAGIHNFMANGLVVHNCVGGVWSEASRRYISDEPSYYFPRLWHTRPDDVKQGSGEIVYDQDGVDSLARGAVEGANGCYLDLLDEGVAPEEARMILPLNMMTTVVWTGSLLFWSRVYNQRIDGHAQLAAQELASKIGDIVGPLYPVSWKALTA